MELPSLVPIEYRGELVAVVSPRRVHIVAPWLLRRPAGDHDLRFAALMCVCCAEVLCGAIPGPFTSTLAERWARHALIDEAEVRALGDLSEMDAAARLRVPVEQLRAAREGAASASALPS